jgi:tRNA threonylcarbamoyladenosine biosynthesis protein TsaB
MALLLCIETATRVCSVSLSRDTDLLAIRESDEPNIHAAILTVFIDEMMRQTNISLSELDAIAVSMGPGSYTGLRIGVAAAKGLCYALNKPLIAVSTLQAMASGMKDKVLAEYPQSTSHLHFCPMIDARRMEVYCGFYNNENHEIREVRAEIVDEHSFSEFLETHAVVFGGDGAEKCKPILGNHPNANFLDGFAASAKFMGAIAMDKFNRMSFENLAYFEPFYLKDFVAGKPHVKGLR